MEKSCPGCKQQQWSEQDKKYLKLFGYCWECNNQWWADGNMDTEEFEKRERISLDFEDPRVGVNI